MKKCLGDILVQDGKLSPHDLDKALTYQMRQIMGRDPGEATEFLLAIARTKYNHRERYYLGRILTELKMLPEDVVRQALEAQKAAPVEKPRSRLDALNQILLRMNSSFNLIDLLNQILVLAAQLVGAESVSLILRDHARDTLAIVMPTGPGAEAVRDLHVPLNRGIVGSVYAGGRSEICNDTAKDPRFFAEIDTASGYSSRQILCVPLSVKNKRLGAIEAINKAGGFSVADQYLLEMFSAQAAVAIENTRLAVALSQAQEDLSRYATNVAAEHRAHAGALVAGALLEEMQRSLTPLRGYATRIGETVDDERLRRYRQYLDREMGRLISHADGLVRFLKGTLRTELRPVDLSELLREFESRAWVECRTRGIAFQHEMKGEFAVSADRELLLTALGNVFRNSCEAMTEGGTFTLKATLGSRQAVIELGDTGRGIEADPVEKALEPFYTRGTPHGAGLGLPIAAKIIELHGGELQVSNGEHGPGAVVTITLPRLYWRKPTNQVSRDGRTPQSR